jgi:hypothetical protein
VQAATPDESVRHVLAHRERRDLEPRGQRRRHVLGRVHRQVEAPIEQRVLQLLHEEALVADLRQRRVDDPVPGRDDRLDAHVEVTV